MEIPRITQILVVCTIVALSSCNRMVDSPAQYEQLSGQIAELREMISTYVKRVEDVEMKQHEYSTSQAKVGRPGPPGPPGEAGPAGPYGVPGRDGRDGRNGDDGKDGKYGEDGQDGKDGRDGIPGATGPAGAAGAAGSPGASGAPGLPGLSGSDGKDGAVGPKGDTGDKGDTGEIDGGAVYTRWGRATCGDNSTLLYEGFVGMSRHDQTGGGVNYQCMVYDPEYNSLTHSFENYGTIAGTEYQILKPGIFEGNANDQNAPCAVCYADKRPTVLQIPGKRTCPGGWQMEYEGYLMSEHWNYNHQSTYECVDASAEYITGESANDGGAHFQLNKPVCDKGVPCPDYISDTAITCVVCTK